MALNHFKRTLLDLLFPRAKLDLTVETLVENSRRAENFNDKDIVVLFDYHDNLPKKLIWELKYKNRPDAAKLLAEAIYAEMLEHLNDWATFEKFENPLLIPVPISKAKFKKRGYNQIQMLITEILKLDCGKNMTAEFEAVVKNKDTIDQSSLKTKSARAKNLKDCFEVVNQEKIRGRNIIIFDDVVTTGATIKEVREVLKMAGARKIKAIAVAH